MVNTFLHTVCLRLFLTSVFSLFFFFSPAYFAITIVFVIHILFCFFWRKKGFTILLYVVDLEWDNYNHTSVY